MSQFLMEMHFSIILTFDYLQKGNKWNETMTWQIIHTLFVWIESEKENKEKIIKMKEGLFK